jgi:hypothetical protein
MIQFIEVIIPFFFVFTKYMPLLKEERSRVLSKDEAPVLAGQTHLE